MKATWILQDGSAVTHEVPEGQSLMAVAVAKGVTGIIGECGGSLSCATCHVVVDPAWADKAGPAEGFEEDMLDVAEAPREETSRLSCQIKMRAELDGITVRVPVS
ncbi:MAG: 2Fe-2S iron-sulfur cluster binding domain-containing protein [Tabrizicola sp.]|nr:2Fe-2S iron-sulfur cluster binding domain-containing protein [Tabrizicola sp.]